LTVAVFEEDKLHLEAIVGLVDAGHVFSELTAISEPRFRDATVVVSALRDLRFGGADV
jgi:hypothetical protein